MDTQVKISSEQGGVFTAQNNRCSFKIPADGHYDLSEAYVNLICSVPITAEEERTATQAAGGGPFALGQGTVTYTSPSTANGRGVYTIGCRITDEAGGNPQDFDLPNAALVKNIGMKCSNYGQIEQCMRNDVYNASVNRYTKNRGDREADSYGNLFKPVQTSGSFDSLFVDLNKEGTVLSRNLERQAVEYH